MLLRTISVRCTGSTITEWGARGYETWTLRTPITRWRWDHSGGRGRTAWSRGEREGNHGFLEANGGWHNRVVYCYHWLSSRGRRLGHNRRKNESRYWTWCRRGALRLRHNRNYASASAKACHVSPKLVNPCCYPLQLCMAVIHISTQPLIQAAHIPHKLTLLVYGRYLGTAMFPKYFNQRVEKR